MTEQQALWLIQKIEREETGKITASFKPFHNGGRSRMAVRVKLIAGQRTIDIISLDQWESVKQAWSVFAET